MFSVIKVGARTLLKKAAIQAVLTAAVEGGIYVYNQVTSDNSSSGGQEQQQLPPPPKVDSGRVKLLRSPSEWIAYYEASKSSDKLILLSITSKWCEPCRTIEPTVNEFAAKYTDVEFVKIDVHDLLGESNDQSWGVNATVPTFLFFKKGTEVDKVVGAKRDELRQKLENFRYIDTKSPRPRARPQQRSSSKISQPRHDGGGPYPSYSYDHFDRSRW